MHVLVATRWSQGHDADDYFHALDGELVRLPPFECNDPECGCTRAFAGIGSHRATTTAMVVDRPEIDEPTLRQILLDDLIGFCDCIAADDPELGPYIQSDLDVIAQIAAEWGPGAVIRRHGTTIELHVDEDSHWSGDR